MQIVFRRKVRGNQEGVSSVHGALVTQYYLLVNGFKKGLRAFAESPQGEVNGNNNHMRVPSALAVLLAVGAQGTVRASTSYSFGSSSNLSLASESTPYVAGSWTEAFFGTISTTNEQIDCIVALTTTTNTCGNPGPGTSQHISLPAASGNRKILPAGTTNYLEVDGDPTYGAPVWTTMQNLLVGQNYTISFYQASNEENGNNKAYNDSWEVYVIPGSGTGPYLCPQSFCAGITTQTSVDSGDLAFTSAAMNNTGAKATPWELQSFTFKATNTTELLEFVTNAVATTSGTFQPPILDLADVTLSAPEPGTSALALLGVGILVAVRKRSRRRSARR